MSTLYKLKIDVTKIEKSRIFVGQRGKYLDLDVWVEDEPDQYGNHASVSHSQTKEEREAGTKKTYLGNGKLVWAKPDLSKPPPPKAAPAEDDADDIPF
jgi:single-stranded DNA-binding protein